MPYCCIPGCEASGKGKNLKRSFHSFPKSRKSIFDKWVQMTKVRWTPAKHVCSLHFDEKCFDKTGQTVRLRNNVIPTKNLGSNAPRAISLTTSNDQFRNFIKTRIQCEHDYCTSATPELLVQKLKSELEQTKRQLYVTERKLKMERSKVLRLTKRVQELEQYQSGILTLFP